MDANANPYASPATARAIVAAVPNRKLYFAAIALLALGIAAEWMAKREMASAIGTAARATARHAAGQPDDSQHLLRHYLWRSRCWSSAGLALAVVGIGCWIISRIRRQSGLQSVPLVLLLFYVLSTLLLV